MLSTSNTRFEGTNVFGKQRRAEVAIQILHKIDTQTKFVIKDKGHFIKKFSPSRRCNNYRHKHLNHQSPHIL